MKTLLKSATMSLALGALLALSPLGFSLQDGDLSLQAPAAHARKGADDAATKTAADDKGGQRARARPMHEPRARAIDQGGNHERGLHQGICFTRRY